MCKITVHKGKHYIKIYLKVLQKFRRRGENFIQVCWGSYGLAFGLFSAKINPTSIRACPPTSATTLRRRLGSAVNEKLYANILLLFGCTQMALPSIQLTQSFPYCHGVHCIEYQNMYMYKRRQIFGCFFALMQ